ncbi:hypothetical protein EVJ50_10545 [Synechococcus sp. RSCCF101]|nr:hypothetical protein EVJ50_10545 [Synechococcus sp. RSCCF101]
MTLTLVLWSAALLASAALRWCGNRWPEPLPPSTPLVLLLVLGPPALLSLWLLSRWPGRPGGGESLQ